ncbi:MAG: glycosyltransferase [Myxococcota bacterium]
MSQRAIRLFDGPPRTETFQFDDLPPSTHTPRPVDDIEAEITTACEAGAQWIAFEGWDPTAHPELERLVWHCDDYGVRVKILASGHSLDQRGVLENLRNGGIAQITFTLLGHDAASHDDKTGREGSYDELMGALEVASKLNSMLVTVRAVLLASTHAHIASMVASVRELADRIVLVRMSAMTRDPKVLKAHAVKRAAAVEAVETAWRTARQTQTRMLVRGFGTWPAPPRSTTTGPAPVDGTLLDLLRNQVPVPSAGSGTTLNPNAGELSGAFYAIEQTQDLADLGLQLAAYGCPARELPLTMGGRGEATPDSERGIPTQLVTPQTDVAQLVCVPPAWTHSEGDGRIDIVVPPLTDNILALTTLPALRDALSTAGETVGWHSIYEAPFNTQDPQHPLPEGPFGQLIDGRLVMDERAVHGLTTTPARIAWTRKHQARWWDTLDFSTARMVVVPGFDAAHAVAQHPTLSSDARVVIADFHLMSGMSRWHETWLPTGQRSMDGGWWPDERFVIHALYPRYIRAYWRAGVPARQILWRPYPLSARHFPPGPAVESCTGVFAGGTHRRDWTTLAAALQRLGPAAPQVDVYSATAAPAPLHDRGEVRLAAFYEHLANSRYVILPMDGDHRRPAGISVISMALAAGRPVIATATPGTIDHLRHGVNAILVPPGRPGSLARAIQKLESDPELLRTLSEGARASFHEVSVARWADILLNGPPQEANFDSSGTGIGPFFPWPHATTLST